MRLLVLGANGLLGSNVVRAGQGRGWTVIGTYHSTEPQFDVPLAQFDLGEYGSFDGFLEEHDPDVVINCAAMTDVDGCETDQEQAHAINAEAPGAIAEACDSRAVEFVHVSTDYVFDGSARDPYGESSAPNPVQTYGESKLAGEQAVQEAMSSALVPRLSFVWGIHRSTGDLTGFPTWVLDQLRASEDVPLFTDQWITPTRAGQAAETILDLVEADENGLFHVACTSCVTPHEFGSILADHVTGEESTLVEGSTEDVQRDATRPAYSCLSVDRVQETLGRAQPTLREDVEAVSDAFR